MENYMQHEMETLGPSKGVYRDITYYKGEPNEKNMDNEMATGEYRGNCAYLPSNQHVESFVRYVSWARLLPT